MESVYFPQPYHHCQNLIANNITNQSPIVEKECFKMTHKFHVFIKLLSVIFWEIFIFHQMIVLQKLRKMFLISSKNFFLFLRYSNFCISVFHSFSLCQPLLYRLLEDKFSSWWRLQLSKKELNTHIVWYLEKENKYKGMALKPFPLIEY